MFSDEMQIQLIFSGFSLVGAVIALERAVVLM